MTKEEAVKAAAARVPVVYRDPMAEKDVLYNRISAIVWEYTTRMQLERGAPEKRILLQLEDKKRAGTSIRTVPLERVEVANQKLWPAQADLFEPEPEKTKNEPKKFQKPTFGEISDYCAEARIEIDIQAFLDHYDACDWYVGRGKKMKDWKAAVRNWKRREVEFGRKPESQPEKPSSFDTDAFFDLAVQKSYGGDL